MSTFQKKFESVVQTWETPQNLFNRLNDEFGFTIDLAADETNHKVDKYYTKKDNALLQKWEGIGWLNPPYGESGVGKLAEWVKKSYISAQENDAVIVMLIPARTNTRYWKNYIMKAKEIRFISGRVKFGTATHGLPQALAIIVFARTENDPIFSMYDV